MCGIFGFNLSDNSLTTEERTLLAAKLGEENDSRGGDSYGAYIVNGDTRIVKGIGKIATSIPWPSLLREAKILMGHTRKATVGGITVDNAHPFVNGNIVGAHNGWISNHKEMNEKYKRGFEVDSMHIFAHLQKGWRLTELTGYGAVEYTNQKKWPSRIKLCKISEHGDLAVAGLCSLEPGGEKGIAWSSSEAHLERALKMAGLEGRYFLFKVDPHKIYVADSGKLYVERGKEMSLGETKYSTSYYGTSTGNNYSYDSRCDTSYQYSSLEREKGFTAVKSNDDGYAYLFADGAKTYVDSELLALFTKHDDDFKKDMKIINEQIDDINSASEAEKGKVHKGTPDTTIVPSDSFSAVDNFHAAGQLPCAATENGCAQQSESEDLSRDITEAEIAEKANKEVIAGILAAQREYDADYSEH